MPHNYNLKQTEIVTIAGVHAVEKSFIPRLGGLRLVGRNNCLEGLILTVKLEDMGVLCYTESVDCASLLLV